MLKYIGVENKKNFIRKRPAEGAELVRIISDYKGIIATRLHTNIIRDLFSGTNPAKKLLRDIGLKLADTLPGVKPQLIRQAMGLNDLPEWLR